MLTWGSTTFTTWYLYWGWGCHGADRECQGALLVYIWKMKTVYCKVLLKTQDSLLQTIEHELRSMGPKFVPPLAITCLSLGGTEGACGGDGVGCTSDKTAAWPTGWWHVMLTCSSTTWPLDACTGGGVVVIRRANMGCRGHWGLHMKNGRQSIAKYSWKLKMVYCRQ